MTTRNFEELENLVAEALDEYKTEAFESAWRLGKDIAGDIPILGFYFAAEEGYGNAAMISQDLLVDIEGEDETKDEEPTSHFDVQRLSSISGIEFHRTPVEDVAGSEDAKLTLLLYVAGSEVVERWWVAHTAAEERQLLGFGKILFQMIQRG